MSIILSKVVNEGPAVVLFIKETACNGSLDVDAINSILGGLEGVKVGVVVKCVLAILVLNSWGWFIASIDAELVSDNVVTSVVAGQ